VKESLVLKSKRAGVKNIYTFLLFISGFLTNSTSEVISSNVGASADFDKN